MIDQSTAIVFGLSMAVIALCLLLAYLADAYIRLNHAYNGGIEEDHNACLGRIILEMGDRAVAHRLRLLAEQYESPDEVATIRRIARTRKERDPMLPAMWLMHHADLLDPPSTCEDHEHTFDGRCVL